MYANSFLKVTLQLPVVVCVLKANRVYFFMGYVRIFMFLFCSSTLALASTWAQ